MGEGLGYSHCDGIAETVRHVSVWGNMTSLIWAMTHVTIIVLQRKILVKEPSLRSIRNRPDPKGTQLPFALPLIKRLGLFIRVLEISR